MTKPSQNRFVTVTELCALIGLSKNRFYALQKAGIFPAPLRNPSNNRPVFDSALVEQCLGIVRNRIGANGAPYVPNRKRAAATPDSRKKPSGRHQGLIEALASLGLTATAAQVEEALGRLPEGGAGLEEPEVIRRVFLELRKKA
jgi:predicted DNA-binding transcriptional regulator AlpA